MDNYYTELEKIFLLANTIYSSNNVFFITYNRQKNVLPKLFFPSNHMKLKKIVKPLAPYLAENYKIL